MKTIRRRCLRMREPAAFTLIEVLVTLVILSTGIVLVLRAFETSLVALGDARASLWGSFLMRQKTAEAELTLKAGLTPSYASDRFEYGPYRGLRCDREVRRIDGIMPVPPRNGYDIYEISTVVSKPGFRLNVGGTTRVIRPERHP